MIEWRLLEKRTLPQNSIYFDFFGAEAEASGDQSTDCGLFRHRVAWETLTRGCYVPRPRWGRQGAALRAKKWNRTKAAVLIEPL